MVITFHLLGSVIITVAATAAVLLVIKARLYFLVRVW